MAMAKNPIPVLCLVFVFLLYSALASSDNSYIIAQKIALLKTLENGAERVTVTVIIYNKGDATAYDVISNDESWNHTSTFDLVRGSTSMSYERIDPGMVLHHSFELAVKTGGEAGPYGGKPSVVSFYLATISVRQVIQSNQIMPLHILGYSNTWVYKIEKWLGLLTADYVYEFIVALVFYVYVYLRVTKGTPPDAELAPSTTPLLVSSASLTITDDGNGRDT